MLSKQIPSWKEDSAFQRWMGTITRKSTKRSYKSWFRCYMEFTQLTPSQLIDEALEDMKRDPREKQGIVMQRLINFYHWLKTDYQKKPKGKDKTKPEGKGVSDKTAHARIGAVRSFYATFGVTVRMKGRQSLPRPRVENKRMKVGAEQVRVLINHTRGLRDRAIILTMFQGGMDVSTLCSVKYRDVAKGLEKQEHPLRLDLYRPKTGVEYYTFLGKDAVKAIKAYISDMESRGVTFTFGTPLFLKERGKTEGITPNLIQNMMKLVAVNSGFVDAKNNGKAFNPLGPHALRESFGSLMINSGVPDTIVDFWLGHSIGEMSEAYKSVQFESLQKMYINREKLLSLSAPKVDVQEIERKIKFQVHEESSQLNNLVAGLASENLKIKNDLEALKKNYVKLESLYEATAQLYKQLDPKELEKTIREILREEKGR